LKILLAIDESPSSEDAISEVEGRYQSDTTVRVLHVVPKFVPPAATLLDAGGNLEEARAQVVGRFQKMVEGVEERLKATGFTMESTVRDGDPGKVIVKEAEEWGADLIVMGSHRYGPLKRMIMGSVAKYVMDRAPCSVEIAHRKEQPGNG